MSRVTYRLYTDIYSFFPAFRALSFLTIILIYTYIIPTAPSGLDRIPGERVPEACRLMGPLGLPGGKLPE
jgi:hypothetical protein